MNVYKMKGQAEGGVVKAEVKELKIDPRPAPPYRARVKVADKETQVTPERDSVVVKENKVTKGEEEAVPAWFKSYMDRFKDQVVREVVDRMCSEFSGQCCTHRASDHPSEEPSTSGTQMPTVSSTTPRTSNSTPNCSSCKGPATGGGYHCSVCPSCILCEPCSHKHDPSHNLKRTRTPLSVPERGVTPEPRFLRRGDRTVRKAERQRLKAERRQLKAEVKEIKKKLRLEKRGLLWSGATNGASSTGLGPASVPAPAPAPGPVPAPGPDPQASSPEGPKVSCSTLVPTMTALFLDENLPDGTCLEPGTKFIKHWKMRNTGNISWTSETKLKFMWGNLALESRDQKEVAVPFLKPGEVGVVTVAFVAPILEGTYTSHWRLAHCGVQFGPRVWCSIVVVPSSGQKPSSHCSKSLINKPNLLGMDGMGWSGSRDCETQVSSSCQREYYIPSVDLLTAQDLLSFELLDINIVQELEKVPANTPVDMTPCMSPVPHFGPVFGKHGLGLLKEDTKHKNTGMKKLQVVQPQRHTENIDAQAHDEGDDDISGTQFVCETVIRSLTLEEEPEHKPRRRARARHGRPEVHEPAPFNERSLMERIDRPLLPVIKRPEAPPPVQPPAILEEPVIPGFSELIGSNENLYTDPAAMDEEDGKKEDQDKEEEAGEWDEVSSQASSASSEEYIVVLPDCFDTSKPLADSMYSSAISQSGTSCPAEPDRALDQTSVEAETSEPAASIQNSVNRLLCTSQILSTPALIPEVIPAPISLSPPPVLHTHRSIKGFETENQQQGFEKKSSCTPEDSPDGLTTHMEAPVTACDTCSTEDPRLRHGGLTDGLVKGALSVAASAYKALFTGQSSSAQRPNADPACEEASMIAVLHEMGFSDKLLNQRLLRKHQYNLLDVVNELVQMTDNEWYMTRH
ncbi:NBR1 autophagy cargo receptor a isoform X3 [Hoplias malabaricus]